MENGTEPAYDLAPQLLMTLPGRMRMGVYLTLPFQSISTRVSLIPGCIDIKDGQYIVPLRTMKFGAILQAGAFSRVSTSIPGRQGATHGITTPASRPSNMAQELWTVPKKYAPLQEEKAVTW